MRAPFRITFYFLVIATALSLPSALFAQPSDVITDELKKDATAVTADQAVARPSGWTLSGSVMANAAFGHSHKVIGADDGITFQFGIVLDGLAVYWNDFHEFRMTLGLKEGMTKTPRIDLFLKSIDELRFQATYLYHVPSAPWVGPFVQATVTTAIFPGSTARSADTVVKRVETDGTPAEPDELVRGSDAIDLTTWAEPLTLRTAAGVFLNPVEKPEAKIHIQIGIGGNHTFTQGGYSVGAEADNVMTLNRLQDYHQAGGELELTLGGQINEFVGWGANASFFQPFYSTVTVPGVEGIDQMILLLGAKLGVKIFEYMSIDYVLGAKREPLLLFDWQVTNQVLLTVGYKALDKFFAD